MEERKEDELATCTATAAKEAILALWDGWIDGCIGGEFTFRFYPFFFSQDFFLWHNMTSGFYKVEMSTSAC